MKQIYLIFVIFIIHRSWATYPDSYGKSKRIDAGFLPSGPGKTPNCVKDPRMTYCITPKKYPKDRILYLLKNKMFDMDTLLQDETRDTYTFEAREGMIIPAPMMYGPVQPTRSYSRPEEGYKRSMSAGSSYSNKQNSSYSHGPWNSKTPSFNSFTLTYPTKYDSDYRSNRGYQGYSTGNDDSSYTHRQKNDYTRTTSSYNSSPDNRYWWKKNSGRHKRQTNIDDLCPTQSSYIMPRAAQSVEGDWMYLVNVGSDYRQLIKSETCLRNTCEGACSAPDGFNAICQQQYVQKRLVALDGSGIKLSSETFWFPSCCICKIRPVEG